MTKTGKIIISVSVVAALAATYPISNTVSEVKQEIINKAANVEALAVEKVLKDTLSDLKKEVPAFSGYSKLTCDSHTESNNEIQCIITNLQFSTVHPQTKLKTNITVDNIIISNPEDIKTRIDVMNNVALPSDILQPGFKSNFKIRINDIKVDNVSPLTLSLNNVVEQSKVKYGDKISNELSTLLTPTFSKVNIVVTDNSYVDSNGVFVGNNEIQFETPNSKLFTNVNYEMTKKAIELNSKTNEELLKLSKEEQEALNQEKMNEVKLNQLTIGINNTQKDFIRSLFKIVTNAESGKEVSEQEFQDNLDLNMGQLVQGVSNGPLDPNLVQSIKIKLMEISQGKTSDFELQLVNTKGFSFAKSIEHGMLAYMYKNYLSFPEIYTVKVK